MSPLKIYGATSGYSQISAPDAAADQSFTLPTTGGPIVTSNTGGTTLLAGSKTFTLPGTAGTVDTLNRTGNILQVVSATYSSEVTSTSATYADTGLTASITPSSVSSRIIVMTFQSGRVYDNVGSPSGNVQLLRGSTVLERVTFGNAAVGDGGTPQAYYGCSFNYLDSPSSTSSLTYKTQFAIGMATTMQINGFGGVGQASSIILMEVAA